MNPTTIAVFSATLRLSDEKGVKALAGPSVRHVPIRVASIASSKFRYREDVESVDGLAHGHGLVGVIGKGRPHAGRSSVG